MDTERNLLFGVVALQSGAVDPDRLAETCAAWATAPEQPLGDLFVGRGLLTDEQKTEVDKAVARELESYGGDAQATLAATIDGRSLEAIRDVAAGNPSLEAKLSLPPQVPGGHVMLEKISAGDAETRERYTLTHLHAKGGMGRVWLARDSALGRQIALKELRPEQADNSIVWSRFLYEAKITAQLEHPGIVPVYEVGEGDSPYYTMRFVRGRTLCEATRAYHKKRAAGEADALGLVELLTAFVGVCHAVAYAHSRGIVHRDLKGQNVVMGDYGEVMVLDWGLAKRIAADVQAGAEAHAGLDEPPSPADSPVDATLAADQDDGQTLPENSDGRLGLASHHSGSNGHASGSNGHASHHSNGSSASGRRTSPESGAGPDGTMQGQLLGTPAYMAPEQAQGRHDLVDERTDVYGLGAILYEILTGRPPFIAPKTAEIIRKVCQEEATAPRQIVPTIGPGLEAICLKALRKDKEGRYESAAELAIEVQRFMADEPVRAYAEPWLPRALRWARRHRTLVSTAAGLLVTATIALGISTLLVSRERDEAEAQGQQARRAVNLLTQVKDIGFEDQLDPVQKEFLEHALAYYGQFTSRAARDPAILLEHGRAYQQMGDIERKLGKPTESEQSYLEAIKILEPLAKAAGTEPKQELARTRTRMANLLVRQGADKGRAERLYQQALEVQETLAGTPAASTEDRLALGQTLKSQADLLRLNGKPTQAKAVYDRALALLEHAHAADTKHSEIRNDLALTADARGWINRELNDLTQAEKDYRRALDLLDKLVTEFPTKPRYRESLARACNSLALIDENAGRLDSAESLLQRELPLVERLAQDFPDRPEHGRELARTLTNLGNILSMVNRFQDAEPVLRRAVDVNTALSAKNPEDVQIRLDLARDLNNLGEAVRKQGDDKQAVDLFVRARSINEALVNAFPDQPRYRETLAGNLGNLALALKTVDPTRVEATLNEALALYAKLVSDYPKNPSYRLSEAQCLENQGVVIAAGGRVQPAKRLFETALARLDGANVQSQSPEWLRVRAGILNDLGELDLDGAEDAYRRAIALCQTLMEHLPVRVADRHTLAIVQNNLGQLLVDKKRLNEAGPMFAQSVANFEQLIAEAPKAIAFQSQVGTVLVLRGKWFDLTGNIAEARAAMTSAIEHQRQAVLLSKNAPAYRELVAGHMFELALLDLKLGNYEDAARIALELPRTVPSASRGQACFTAARVLARLVNQAGRDAKLAPADRDRLTRNHLGRAVVLLRDAIDTSPALAEQVKADADIKLLEARPEFQTIMNTLVNLGSR